jgi:adenylate cyclase
MGESASMTWRRGFFDGPPRVLFRRTGARYIDACAATIVAHGIVVAGFGVVTLVLYVDLRVGELALFAACSVAWYLVEGAVAAMHLHRAATPIRRWLAGERHDDLASAAWSAATRLPLVLLRRRTLHAIGATGALAVGLVAAALLELPAYEAALVFPVIYLLYLYSAVLRYLGLELCMRPVLKAIGERLTAASPPESARVSLHHRLVATLPMVNWGAGVVVAGLLTENTRDLDTIGLAGLIAIAVTAVLSIWLSLVLADAVSGPIADLRDAMRGVGEGDLAVRVPVVSTDETGELSASFNAMLDGLDERERLREAFGAFVDPALTSRVLEEGTDLRGEEIEVSVLFLDVRGFTGLAERAAAHEVLASLNELYEAVVPVILAHGGHVNKFIGDGLLAVFGAPERRADHAVRAVAAARDIARLVRSGLGGRLRVGVGVNTGRVMVGTVGGGGRRDFTVIGDPVNTAARVEAVTRLTGDEILITDATLRALGPEGGDFEERPAVPLKGKSATVSLFAPREDVQSPAGTRR